MYVLGCYSFIFIFLVDLKKLIQCVSLIDLYMIYDVDVSRCMFVGICKYEFVIIGFLQNKCVLFNYVL